MVCWCRAIPVVCSLYRQKPRRQHLCIVERLLDFVVVSGSETRFTLCCAPQLKKEDYTLLRQLLSVVRNSHWLGKSVLQRPLFQL